MSGFETKRASVTRESTREDKRRERVRNNGNKSENNSSNKKNRGSSKTQSKDLNTNNISEKQTRNNERTRNSSNTTKYERRSKFDMTGDSNSINHTTSIGFQVRNSNQTQPSYSSFFSSSSSSSSFRKANSQQTHEPTKKLPSNLDQISEPVLNRASNSSIRTDEMMLQSKEQSIDEKKEEMSMGASKIMSWSKVVSRGKEEPKLVDYEIDTPNGTLCRSEVLKTHWKLNDSWTLWVHDVQNPNWGEDDYTQMSVIKTINNVYSCCNNIKTFSEQMYFLMKGNIFPNWENEANCNGGAWSLKVNKKIAGQRAFESDRVWMEILMALVGGYLTENIEDMKCINGITISPKQTHHCIIKIWNNDKTKSNSSVISQTLFENYVNSKLPIRIRGKDEMISYFDNMIYRAHCEQSDFKQK